jgi:cellulose synthase/poly-beta-1,6-N-acetylglucosamine synthase-like glycosyltransferase
MLLIYILLFLITLPGSIEMIILTFSNVLIKTKHKKNIRKNIKLAILIPAHNEEKNIKRCVESIKKCKTTYKYDIYVIADNCNDNTAIYAKEANANVMERENDIEKGKGYALKYAFDLLEKYDYEAYIIVDADTVVKENFIEVMGDNFSNGEEAIQCTYLVNEPEKSKRTKFMNLALMSMNAFRPLGREKLNLSVGILGNGFGLSKKLLSKVPYNANSIAEDLEFHLKIVRKGERVKFTKQTQVLADFPVSEEGNETQRARWEGGRFYLQRKFGPKLLKDILKGEISLIEPFLELMTLPLAFQMICLLTLFLIGNFEMKLYSFGSIFIIFIHIILSVLFFGKVKDLTSLIEVPIYILWKLAKIPLIVKQSNKNAQWIRTKRD